MTRFFGAVGRLAALATVVGGFASAAGASRPYLSWKQKGDILWTGTVADADGNRYNIRIMPGYKNAFGFGTGSWGDGWSQQVSGVRWIYSGLKDAPMSLARLKEYGTAEPWEGIGEGFGQGGDMIAWAATDMMTKGAAGDWREYWGDARSAQERESFGWWLSYPWAMVKGTVNTAVRQAIGMVVIGAGVSWAMVLRPAYQLAKPVVLVAWDLGYASGEAGWGVIKAGWGLGVNQVLLGTATPIAGWAWNTALGLPMAIAGKVPSPKSVDGWWVSQVSGIPYVEGDGRSGQSLTWDGVDPLSDTAKTNPWFAQQIRRASRTRGRDSVSNFYAPALAELERQRDSLDEIRDTLRRRMYRDLEDVDRSFPGRGEVSTDWYRCRGESDQPMNDSLRQEIRRRIQLRQPENRLSDSLVEAIVDDFGKTWGRCYKPKAISGTQDDPNAKFNPNDLVKDEVRQILK